MSQDMQQQKPPCATCWGYGLWWDGTAPMGPMDARDGMPTIACPECGADYNSVKQPRTRWPSNDQEQNRGSQP